MATKRIKKRTLSEFNAWLEGIEEIQPNDWHPTKEQWGMIRHAIQNIKEVSVKKTVVDVMPQPVVQYPVSQLQPLPVAPVHPQPAPQLIGSSIDNIPIVPGSNNPNVKKDIDTSDGIYVSDFS